MPAWLRSRMILLVKEMDPGAETASFAVEPAPKPGRPSRWRSRRSAVLLGGCQALSNLSSGDIKESAFQPSDNPVTVDIRSPRNNRLAELAKAQHPRILATYGGEYSDPKLERMVAKVVGNLTTVSDNPDAAYRITILNSPNVNAFALPGGYLYVTRGLLALANDSAELAAVIAHEMGHVTANHGAAAPAEGSRGGSGDQGRHRRARRETRPPSVALIRGKLRLAQFSRNQELEADAIGIKTSGQAGYDPFAAARFLQSMAAYSDFRSISGATDPSLDFLASHPNAPQRIELARAHARAVRRSRARRDATATPSSPASTACSSATRPRKAMCAAAPSCIRGLGISFSVPPASSSTTRAAAVTATGPGRHRDPLRRRRRSTSASAGRLHPQRLGRRPRSDSVRSRDDQRQRGGDRRGAAPTAGSSTSRSSGPAARSIAC